MSCALEYLPLSSQVNPIPEEVARVASLMSTFSPDWALCGGWAVDSWLGRRSRDHGDIDVTVFHDDQTALFAQIAGWKPIAHDPNVPDDTEEPWDGRHVDLPAHIHTVAHEGCKLEVILNERTGHDWGLSKEPGLTMPWSLAVQQSGWGVLTVVPEILLFYKAADLRSHDEADFQALLPHLTAGQRSWLTESIAVVYPGHRWLSQLRL